MASCPSGYIESFEDFDPFGNGDAVCIPMAKTDAPANAANAGKDDKKKGLGGLSFSDIVSALGQLGKVGAGFYATSKGQSTQPIINNNYTTDPNAAKDDKMPVWAIALIALVVLVLLAVIFSNFKKKGAAIPQ